MLTVIYKLASAAIANRIKPVLDTLISCNQNGFVPGRYIGESTRVLTLFSMASSYNFEKLSIFMYKHLFQSDKTI